MTAWEPAGEDRWKSEDEIGQRHLLLKRGELYFELHGMTVHTYRGPSSVPDEMWPLGDPSIDAMSLVKHVRTEERETALALHTDDAAWAWLGKYADVELERETPR